PIPSIAAWQIAKLLLNSMSGSGRFLPTNKSRNARVPEPSSRSIKAVLASCDAVSSGGCCAHGCVGPTTATNWSSRTGVDCKLSGSWGVSTNPSSPLSCSTASMTSDEFITLSLVFNPGYRERNVPIQPGNKCSEIGRASCREGVEHTEQV